MTGYAQSVQQGNEQCMTGGYYDQYIAVSLFHSSHFSSTLARVFHGWQFLQENLSVLVQALHRLQKYLLHHGTPHPPPLTFLFPLLFSLLFVPFFPCGTFFPWICFHACGTSLADGLSCVLWWLHFEGNWNHLCPAKGSPWPLLQPPVTNTLTPAPNTTSKLLFFPHAHIVKMTHTVILLPLTCTWIFIIILLIVQRYLLCIFFPLWMENPIIIFIFIFIQMPSQEAVWLVILKAEF